MLWKEKWNFGLNSKLKVRLKFATGHDIVINLNQVFSGCDADFMIIMGHGLFAAVENPNAPAGRLVVEYPEPQSDCTG